MGRGEWEIQKERGSGVLTLPTPPPSLLPPLLRSVNYINRVIMNCSGSLQTYARVLRPSPGEGSLSCRNTGSWFTRFHPKSAPFCRFLRHIAMFRVSAHNLYIERGRHSGKARNNRICKCCSRNGIEDEYHFILVCPCFSEVRQKLIKNVLFLKHLVFLRFLNY